MALRLRRGTDSERQLITPVEGELIYTTDTKLLYAGDGSTVGGTLVTGAGGGGSLSLNSLTDTDLTGASNNDILTYVSASNKWEAISVPGVGVLGLNDISGVFMPSTPLNGDALIYDGANWTGRPISDFFNEQQNYKINIVGNDSTIIVDTNTNTVTGNFVGNVTGDVTGDTAGTHTGAVVGDVTGDTAGTHTGNVTGNLTGNANGAHTGTFDGDMHGSLFADDSTLIVDGVGNTISIQSLLAATTSTNSVTAEGILDLKSNTNVVRTTATGVKLVSQTVGGGIEQGPVHRTTTSRGTLAAPTTVAVGDSILSISGEGYDGAAYKTQAVINIGVSENTVGTEATPGRIDFSIRDDNGTFTTSFARLESNGVFTAPAIQSLGITTTVKNSLLAKVSGGLGLQGTIVYDTTLAGLSYYHGTDGWNNILTGNKPVETTSFIKPGVYADNAARDAAITTPTAGMMVFNTTGTKFQGYTGSAWVDLN